MKLKFWLVFLVVAIALVAKHSSANAISGGGNFTGGLVADDINDEEELMMDSESSRRILAQGKKYISYAALKANSVPCSKRGRSYYGCNVAGRQRANPYKRACTVITKCYRFTH